MHIDQTNLSSIWRGTALCLGFLVACRPAPSSTTPPKDSAESSEMSAGMTTVDLVTHDGWSLIDAGADPYPSHRTPTYTCDQRGVVPEDGVLEINTNDCGYALLGQPILSDIQAGDRVELLMYHSALASTEATAEAHFSLWLGPHEFWGRTVAIPAAAEVYPVPLEVDFDLAAGSPAIIHLHNHGGNSWRVASLRRSRTDDADTYR